MQNLDPFTTGWLLALMVAMGAVIAIPIIRALAALALHAYAVLTGQHAAHALAQRVMPRIGHLIASVVVGMASTAAPAMAQNSDGLVDQSISVDRDAAPIPVQAPSPKDPATPSADIPSVDRAATASQAVAEPAPSSDLVYVVRVGDSLWDIAQSHLDHPTDQQTTDAWKAIWKANRAVIGDHPEFIAPGQVLHLDGLA